MNINIPICNEELVLTSCSLKHIGRILFGLCSKLSLARSKQCPENDFSFGFPFGSFNSETSAHKRLSLSVSKSKMKVCVFLDLWGEKKLYSSAELT